MDFYKEDDEIQLRHLLEPPQISNDEDIDEDSESDDDSIFPKRKQKMNESNEELAEFNGQAKIEYLESVDPYIEDLSSGDFDRASKALETQLSFLTFKDNTEPSMVIIESGVFHSIIENTVNAFKDIFYQIVRKMILCNEQVIYNLIRCGLIDRLVTSGDLFNETYVKRAQFIISKIIKTSKFACGLLFASGFFDTIYEHLNINPSLFYRQFSVIMASFVQQAPLHSYLRSRPVFKKITYEEITTFQEDYSDLIEKFNTDLFEMFVNDGYIAYDRSSKQMTIITCIILTLLDLNYEKSFYSAAYSLIFLIQNYAIPPTIIYTHEKFIEIFDDKDKLSEISPETLFALLKLIGRIIYQTNSEIPSAICDQIFSFLITLLIDSKFEWIYDDPSQIILEVLQSLTNLLITLDYSEDYIKKIKSPVYDKIISLCENSQYLTRTAAVDLILVLAEGNENFHFTYDLMTVIVELLDPNDSKLDGIKFIINHLQSIFQREGFVTYINDNKTARALFLDTNGADRILSLMDVDEISALAEDFFDNYADPDLYDEADRPDLAEIDRIKNIDNEYEEGEEDQYSEELV